VTSPRGHENGKSVCEVLQVLRREAVPTQLISRAGYEPDLLLL
jgi:hypothetical protein